jgi:hypothetical protein
MPSQIRLQQRSKTSSFSASYWIICALPPDGQVRESTCSSADSRRGCEVLAQFASNLTGVVVLWFELLTVPTHLNMQLCETAVTPKTPHSFTVSDPGCV